METVKQHIGSTYYKQLQGSYTNTPEQRHEKSISVIPISLQNNKAKLTGKYDNSEKMEKTKKRGIIGKGMYSTRTGEKTHFLTYRNI